MRSTAPPCRSRRRRRCWPFGRSGTATRLLVLHGPERQKILLRELPARQEGEDTALQRWLASQGSQLDCEVGFAHLWEEGALCRAIGEAETGWDGLVVNFGLLRYSSLLLWNALRTSSLPCVEVIPYPEVLPESRASLTGQACLAAVSGMGLFSYRAALEFLLTRQSRVSKPVITRHSSR